MIPSPWVGVILVFASYRLTRLVGWDEFPVVAKLRAWVIGERWVTLDPEATTSQFPRPTMQEIGSDEDWLGEPSLPGKTPTSEVEGVRPAYDRPTLAHLIHCPFCLGWWMSLAVYLAFLAAPSWTLVILAPLAISGAVGLVAKNLDA